MSNLTLQFKELNEKYYAIKAQLARKEAKGKIESYTKIFERFDNGFNYFFDADEIRSKYDANFEKSNSELLQELDKKDYKKFIDFYKEYIEYLEQEIEE